MVANISTLNKIRDRIKEAEPPEQPARARNTGRREMRAAAHKRRADSAA